VVAAVISARLIPWEPGMVPGIAYELDDGSQACVAGPLAWTIPDLMKKLSSADRREFEEQMSDAYGGATAER
jgi:hypothetical protein